MTLFERMFGKKKASADNAKARLKVMLATERADCHIPYLEDLKREILAVVQKYTGTSTGNVNIKTEKQDDVDMLELEISLGKN
jgi:cell division topological specificity factor